MDIKPRKLIEEEIWSIMQLLYMDGHPMIILSEGYREIGELLKIKRVADEMNLSDLSKVLKLSPGTISEIENCKRDLPRGKEKDIRDYIYKQLYRGGELDINMVDDEDDGDEYTTN